MNMKKFKLMVKGKQNEVLMTEDKRYIKMKDLADAMSSNYVYSLSKAVCAVSQEPTVMWSFEVEKRSYQFIDVKMLVSEFNKHKKEIEEQVHRTLFTSIKSFSEELSKVFVANKFIETNFDKKSIEEAIDSIMEKLAFIQEESSKEPEVDLEEINRLKEQLKKSEMKYEELKNINLDLMKEKEKIKSENNELKLFKNSVMGLVKNG